MFDVKMWIYNYVNTYSINSSIDSPILRALEKSKNIAINIAHQSAFVSLNSLLDDIWTRMSKIGALPRTLDQRGEPSGSTGSLVDGTFHVTEEFWYPNSINPPESVVMSHHTWNGW